MLLDGEPQSDTLPPFLRSLIAVCLPDALDLGEDGVVQRHGGHADHHQQRARRGQRAGRAGPVHRLRHQGDADLGGPGQGYEDIRVVSGQRRKALSQLRIC